VPCFNQLQIEESGSESIHYSEVRASPSSTETHLSAAISAMPLPRLQPPLQYPAGKVSRRRHNLHPT
jgi:hypothetical protein